MFRRMVGGCFKENLGRVQIYVPTFNSDVGGLIKLSKEIPTDSERWSWAKIWISAVRVKDIGYSWTTHEGAIAVWNPILALLCLINNLTVPRMLFESWDVLTFITTCMEAGSVLILLIMSNIKKRRVLKIHNYLNMKPGSGNEGPKDLRNATLNSS